MYKGKSICVQSLIPLEFNIVGLKLARIFNFWTLMDLLENSD